MFRYFCPILLKVKSFVFCKKCTHQQNIIYMAVPFTSLKIARPGNISMRMFAVLFVVALLSFAEESKAVKAVAEPMDGMRIHYDRNAPLSVDVVQHSEFSRYTMSQPLTSQQRGEVIAGVETVALVHIDGMPGREVRVRLESESRLSDLNGTGIPFSIDVYWYSGPERSQNEAFRLAKRAECATEFMITLLGNQSRDLRPVPTVGRGLSATGNPRGVLESRVATERSLGMHEAESLRFGVFHELPGRRGGAAPRARAWIFIVPKINADGTQRPGRFLSELKISAEYEELEWDGEGQLIW